jgi:hypothetical protein
MVITIEYDELVPTCPLHSKPANLHALLLTRVIRVTILLPFQHLRLLKNPLQPPLKFWQL